MASFVSRPSRGASGWRFDGRYMGDTCFLVSMGRWAQQLHVLDDSSVFTLLYLWLKMYGIDGVRDAIPDRRGVRESPKVSTELRWSEKWTKVRSHCAKPFSLVHKIKIKSITRFRSDFLKDTKKVRYVLHLSLDMFSPFVVPTYVPGARDAFEPSVTTAFESFSVRVNETPTAKCAVNPTATNVSHNVTA